MIQELAGSMLVYQCEVVVWILIDHDIFHYKLAINPAKLLGYNRGILNSLTVLMAGHGNFKYDLAKIKIEARRYLQTARRYRRLYVKV